MLIRFADETLALDFLGETAILMVNRPRKRNALNRALWRALPEATARVAAEPSAKVMIITGAGGNFAAGADIGEFEAVYANRQTASDYFNDIAAGVEAIGRLAKPTIAQIAGACVGGGMALALACDLRLASDSARLGITPGKLGLMYSLADTKRLVDAVGASAAKDMLFTGRIMPASEALSIGLVDAVHPAASLEAAVAEKAAKIAAASQWSARKAKAVIGLILEGTAADTAETRAWFLDAVEGQDFLEGRDAFLSKRTPVFSYR